MNWYKKSITLKAPDLKEYKGLLQYDKQFNIRLRLTPEENKRAHIWNIAAIMNKIILEFQNAAKENNVEIIEITGDEEIRNRPDTITGNGCYIQKGHIKMQAENFFGLWKAMKGGDAFKAYNNHEALMSNLGIDLTFTLTKESEKIIWRGR